MIKSNDLQTDGEFANYCFTTIHFEWVPNTINAAKSQIPNLNIPLEMYCPLSHKCTNNKLIIAFYIKLLFRYLIFLIILQIFFFRIYTYNYDKLSLFNNLIKYYFSVTLDL